MTVVKKALDHIRTFKNRREFATNSIHASDLVVRFTSHCTARNKGDIIIGNRCEIKGRLFSFEGGKITIGNNVFVNYNSFIGSMDARHSVVTKDVPPYVIVAGNPARVVKRLEEGQVQ